MGQYIQDNGKVRIGMDMEFMLEDLVIDMKVCGKMTKLMDKQRLFIPMELSTKARW